MAFSSVNAESAYLSRSAGFPVLSEICRRVHLFRFLSWRRIACLYFPSGVKGRLILSWNSIQLAAFDRRLLALEIVVRGEDGRNGMKSQLNKLCDRFDQFEKKGIRLIAIGTALPGIVFAVLGVLRFIGKL